MTERSAMPPAAGDALAVVVRAAGGVSMAVPSVVAAAGERAARLTLEFFAARYENEHTRRAYGRAVFDFCAWMQVRGVSLFLANRDTSRAATVPIRPRQTSATMRWKPLRSEVVAADRPMSSSMVMTSFQPSNSTRCFIAYWSRPLSSLCITCCVDDWRT